MSSVWRKNEWILSMQIAEYNKTQIAIYVIEALKNQFTEKYISEWQQWGGQKGIIRRTDGYKPQDFFNIHIDTLTQQTAAALDTQYATLQHQRKQTHTKDEDDEMDGGLPNLRGQRKGEGKYAAQRRQ